MGESLAGDGVELHGLLVSVELRPHSRNSSRAALAGVGRDAETRRESVPVRPKGAVFPMTWRRDRAAQKEKAKPRGADERGRMPRCWLTLGRELIASGYAARGNVPCHGVAMSVLDCARYCASV